MSNEQRIHETIAEMQAILTDAGYSIDRVDGHYEFDFAWVLVDEGGSLDYYRDHADELFLQVSIDGE